MKPSFLAARTCTLSALALAMALPVLAQPQRVGNEFVVNSNTQSKQHNPVAAFAPSGGSVIVWENEVNGLRGQLYAKDGSKAGTELGLVANQNLASLPGEGTVVTRRDPAVGFLGAGDMLLAWTEETAHLIAYYFHDDRTVLDQDVFVARRSPSGNLTIPQRVNVTTAGFQSQPKLATRNGDAIVVWTGGNDVFARFLSPLGRPVGNEIKLNSLAGVTARNPSIAVDAAGNFLVAWEGSTTQLDVYARLFDKNGNPRGTEVRINTDTNGLQRRPAAAAAKDGSWMIVWQGQHGTRVQARIYGQAVSQTGALVGAQVSVSAGYGDAQISPSIARTPSGNFFVLWSDWKNPFPIGLDSVVLSPQGAILTPEDWINEQQMNSWSRTSLATDGNGSFLIPWEGFYGNDLGITAQRLDIN